jgi:hypothetical protein
VLHDFHFYRISLYGNATTALGKFHKQVTNFTTKTAPDYPELESIVSRLTLADLNRALYRCEEEERDESKGASGAYNIPDFGPLVYCGLQGKYWQSSYTVKHCYSRCNIECSIFDTNLLKLFCYLTHYNTLVQNFSHVTNICFPLKQHKEFMKQ